MSHFFSRNEGLSDARVIEWIPNVDKENCSRFGTSKEQPPYCAVAWRSCDKGEHFFIVVLCAAQMFERAVLQQMQSEQSTARSCKTRWRQRSGEIAGCKCSYRCTRWGISLKETKSRLLCLQWYSHFMCTQAGNTTLMEAANGGYVSVVGMLLSRGAQVDTQDRVGVLLVCAIICAVTLTVCLCWCALRTAWLLWCWQQTEVTCQ